MIQTKHKLTIANVFVCIYDVLKIVFSYWWPINKFNKWLSTRLDVIFIEQDIVSLRYKCVQNYKNMQHKLIFVLGKFQYAVSTH